jgi:conjugative transfer signal peptidase TraF
MRLGRCDTVAVLIVAPVGLLFWAGSGFGIRLNTSPSLPFGLYRVTVDSSAPLVEFCPAEPVASFANARGYRQAGSCPDGGTPLMKPIAAHGGDIVEVSAAGVWVNGTLLRNSSPLARDTAGRPLTAWPTGKLPVPPGVVWLISDYHARSFDSRYFGPVPTALIRNHLRPLLVLR